MRSHSPQRVSTALPAAGKAVAEDTGNSRVRSSMPKARKASLTLSMDMSRFSLRARAP